MYYFITKGVKGVGVGKETKNTNDKFYFNVSAHFIYL